MDLQDQCIFLHQAHFLRRKWVGPLRSMLLTGLSIACLLRLRLGEQEQDFREKIVKLIYPSTWQAYFNGQQKNHLYEKDRIDYFILERWATLPGTEKGGMSLSTVIHGRIVQGWLGDQDLQLGHLVCQKREFSFKGQGWSWCHLIWPWEQVGKMF